MIRPILSASLLAASFLPRASAAPAEASQPDFGPNVRLFDPSMDMAAIQKECDTIFAQQERAEFGGERYAILFKPGTYEAEVRVGFYTQVLGLGKLPGSVTIKGAVEVNGEWDRGNVTRNFWRGGENFTVEPGRGGFNRWAVSQAAPLRRVHIKGSLVLEHGGWASGGFLADSLVDGQTSSGPQQQWFSRNSAWKSWSGGVWNMFFLGCVNPPEGAWPERPFTVVPETPVIREKPFLYVDDAGAFHVFRPALRRDSVGTTWQDGEPAGESVPLADFHIARADKDTAATINAALAEGKHLLLTPGIYRIREAVRVTKPGTLVLGLGLPTLVPQMGRAAMEVADEDGIQIAGVLLDAGRRESPVLLEVGKTVTPRRHVENPISLHDVFLRVGGSEPGNAENSLVINSNDVIGDHFWIWRADHGPGAGWTTSRGTRGLVVNGADVTIYGAFVEHYQEDQTLWNGENGRLYFYQCEMPYEPPSRAEWRNGSTNGFPGYKVADTVKRHEAQGMGVYCTFRRRGVFADHAVEAPGAPGIKLRNIVTVRLSGGTDNGINSVIKGTDEAAVREGNRMMLMEYPVPAGTGD